MFNLVAKIHYLIETTKDLKTKKISVPPNFTQGDILICFVFIYLFITVYIFYILYIFNNNYLIFIGHVSSGLAWYINGYMIPELFMKRGLTYVFKVN